MVQKLFVGVAGKFEDDIYDGNCWENLEFQTPGQAEKFDMEIFRSTTF